MPDVPGDEATGLAAAAGAAGLDLVQLVSPLTPPERVGKILAACSGFVYCLSVAGTTGERDALPAELTAHLDRLRQQTDLPLAVGFGVSKPEHAAALRGHADGAIVGSALVRRLEGFADRPKAEVLEDVAAFTREMVAACRRVTLCGPCRAVGPRLRPPGYERRLERVEPDAVRQEPRPQRVGEPHRVRPVPTRSGPPVPAPGCGRRGHPRESRGGSR